jgi:hypothetical protein
VIHSGVMCMHVCVFECHSSNSLSEHKCYPQHVAHFTTLDDVLSNTVEEQTPNRLVAVVGAPIMALLRDLLWHRYVLAAAATRAHNLIASHIECPLECARVSDLVIAGTASVCGTTWHTQRAPRIASHGHY